MNAKGAEWLVVLLFFVCFFAFMAGEVYWLSRNKNVPPGKAFAISFASNLFCITVGFFFSMVLVFGILAMAWDGSLQSVKGGDVTIWAVLIVAAIFPFVLLTIAKFLLLRLFRVETIHSHIKYSAIASLIFLVTVSLVPISVGYLFFR